MFSCSDCPLSLACKVKHKFSSGINSQIKPLYSLDNYHVILAIVEDYLVIALAIALYLFNPWLLPLTLILIGSRMRALATILHESSHKTIAKDRKLNFLAGTVLSGYAIFQSYYAYECSHVQRHHRYLGDPERDPDIQWYIKQGIMDGHIDSKKLRNLFLKTLLGLRIPSTLTYLVINRLLPLGWKNKKRHEKIEYFAFLTYWTVVLGLVNYFHVWDLFLILWVLPYFTTFQVFTWFIELAEHYPLTKIYDNDLRMTRNRLGNSLELFLTGVHGENWHLIHHLRPGIPFWNLSKAHEILLQDPEYMSAAQNSSGLFTTGPNGAKPILVSILSDINSVSSERGKRIAR